MTIVAVLLAMIFFAILFPRLVRGLVIIAVLAVAAGLFGLTGH
jgi:hypothetical protein